MARQSRPSFTKRQKEMARQQKQREKLARKTENRQQEAARPAPVDGQDPEIADIRPGPQPPPAWMEVPQRKS